MNQGSNPSVPVRSHVRPFGRVRCRPEVAQGRGGGDHLPMADVDPRAPSGDADRADLGDPVVRPSWADPTRARPHGIDYDALKRPKLESEGMSVLVIVMVGGLVVLAALMAVLVRWGL